MLNLLSFWQVFTVMLNTVWGGLNPYDALKSGRRNYTLKLLKGSQLKVVRERKTHNSFRNNSSGEERENIECRCCITEYGASLLLHLTNSCHIFWQKMIYTGGGLALFWKAVSETCMVRTECIWKALLCDEHLKPTNKSDSSSKKRIEVASSCINIGLCSNPISSFGQATVENSFSYHYLQWQRSC